MARAVNTDYLHSMRFHVTALFAGSTTNNPLNNDSSPSAGFMSVSTPEATTEAVEYREGTYNYPRKFPGNTTVSDCSMQKGVARDDGTFWNWLRFVIEGFSEPDISDYRADLTIFHYDRRVLQGTDAAYAQNGSSTFSTANAARTYKLENAFPTRHKVAADLDASSSDISIMELDVAYESFEIVEGEGSSSANETLTYTP